MKRFFVLSLVFISLQSMAQKKSKTAPSFLKCSGTKLLCADREVLLKGICFTNDVYSNQGISESHHDGRDYKRVAAMGMNCIRFYMNYLSFESDETPYQYKKEGFSWLDQNIAWAKKNGIYLILNIHVPQGGFQSNGNGHALWTDPENRRRLIALWKAIASHCANETIIAGYDLVNEPVVTTSIKQWQELAQTLTDSIRIVDKNHIIIIERLNAINNNWENNADCNFVKINGDNILYTFHFYAPIEYSHQNTSWTGMGDGGSYPDTSIIETLPHTKWYTATFANPLLQHENTEWTYFEGVPYKIKDPKIMLGKPAFVSYKNSGTTFFDDFVIKEFDENGKYTRTLFDVDPESDSGWWYWSKNSQGNKQLSNEAHKGQGSISISGNHDEANCSSNQYRFKVKQGYSYSISGWMKGVGHLKHSKSQFRIDFETLDPGQEIACRNQHYLEHELLKYLKWTSQYNVPVYVGEFGLYTDCFENHKGGLTWVKDVLDLFDKYKLNYTYHAYHENNFGLYFGSGVLPDPEHARQELIQLFTTHFKAEK
jgi:endoglucanase